MTSFKTHMTEVEKEVRFKFFDIKSIPPGKKILFVGMTGTGKTTLLFDYLYHNKKTFMAGNVISKTERVNGAFAKHVPNYLIFNEFNKTIPEELVKFQSNLASKYPKWFNEHNISKFENPFNSFLIMDDCLSDASAWKKQKIIEQLFYEGRHFNITLIMTLQFSLGLPPNLRNNVDYVFLCSCPKIKEQEKYYTHFGSMFPNFKQFKSIFTEFTKNHGCMVINVLSRSDNLEDQVYYYKATALNQPDWNNFKLCNPKLWQYTNLSKNNENDENDLINTENVTYKFRMD